MEGASTSRNQREIRIDMDNLVVEAKRAGYTISAGDGSVPMLSSAISARLAQPPRWGRPDQKAGCVHHPRRCGNFLKWSVIERALFVATFIGFVVTMAIPDFRTQNFCSLRAWRWAILIAMAFCGRLISKLIVSTILFLITTANISSTTCLYYVKEIQKTLICVTWFAASLTTWIFIFDDDDIVDKTPKREKMQWYVTTALVCMTISAILWLVKILVTKKLELNRYKTIYFERLESALFFQYVLETFIFLPANKMAKELVFAAKVPKKEGTEELFLTLTLDEWDTIDAQNVSAMTLTNFIHIIQHTTLHEYLGEILKHKTSISDQSQCEQAAELMSEEIFNRISGNGMGITLSDIEQTMPSELAKTTFNLVPKQPNSDQISKEAATRRGKQTTLDSDQISKNDLKNWLVRGFKERAYLELSLSDTDGVLKHVRHLLNEVVLALMSLVWLVMFKNIGTMKFIFLELAQVAIITGCFVDTIKTTFQCLRFLFWHRPFDLGDTVTMNSVTMVVEEIRLLKTIFKLPNGNKVTCSNSELVPDEITTHNSKHDIAYAADGISERIEVVIRR